MSAGDVPPACFAGIGGDPTTMDRETLILEVQALRRQLTSVESVHTQVLIRAAGALAARGSKADDTGRVRCKLDMDEVDRVRNVLGNVTPGSVEFVVTVR